MSKTQIDKKLFTDEQIRQANSVNIIEYAKRYEAGDRVYDNEGF